VAEGGQTGQESQPVVGIGEMPLRGQGAMENQMSALVGQGQTPSGDGIELAPWAYRRECRLGDLRNQSLPGVQAPPQRFVGACSGNAVLVQAYPPQLNIGKIK
jgi:hypothetical protein